MATQLVLNPGETQKQILIIGAGVTGLQTALSLLTTPETARHKITIIARHTPGDEDPSYTSPWAGGHWRSHASSSEADKEPREWDLRTYEYWNELLDGVEGKSEDEIKGLGLGRKESRTFWGTENAETVKDGSGLWWKDSVKDFKILPKEETLDGAIFGISYQSISINVPAYLKYLFARVNTLGGIIIKMEPELTTSGGLAGLVRPAKQILGMAQDREVDDSEILCLINCTGLSAKKIASPEEAEKLYPIRGQTVLVKGEASMARTYTHIEGVATEEISYVIPRPGSGTTILGGCKQAHNGDVAVDEELSTRILERIKTYNLAPELLTGPEGTFEVLSSQVGFRPARTGGPRVELEPEKVENIPVLHSYGHAGAGYQNSIGSAEKIVKLVKSLT